MTEGHSTRRLAYSKGHRHRAPLRFVVASGADEEITSQGRVLAQRILEGAPLSTIVFHHNLSLSHLKAFALGIVEASRQEPVASNVVRLSSVLSDVFSDGERSDLGPLSPRVVRETVLEPLSRITQGGASLRPSRGDGGLKVAPQGLRTPTPPTRRAAPAPTTVESPELHVGPSSGVAKRMGREFAERFLSSTPYRILTFAAAYDQPVIQFGFGMVVAMRRSHELIPDLVKLLEELDLSGDLKFGAAGAGNSLHDEKKALLLEGLIAARPPLRD